MLTLTLRDVQSLAQRVIAERGHDFVYNNLYNVYSCYYVPTTDPRFPGHHNSNPAAQITGCVVGEMLTLADLMTDDIAAAKSSITGLVENGILRATLTDQAYEFMVVLQLSQDGGATWGESYKKACISAALRKI